MNKSFAVAGRILSQFRHDKRTIALMLVAPLIVLWLFSVLLGGGTYTPSIAIADVPDVFMEELQEEDVILKEMSKTEALDLLESGEMDAVISMTDDETTLDVLLEGGSRTGNAAVSMAMGNAMHDMALSGRENMKDRLPSDEIIKEMLPVQDFEVSYLHGNDSWDLFDYTGPVFIGIFIFVFTFLTSGMSLVNERSAGTLERFLATPVKPLQILGGYAMGFGLFALVQVTVILTVALNLLDFPNEGSPLPVVLVAVSLAIASVTFGLLVSGLAKTGFQLIQLMILFVVPQILLCGLFDLSGCPGWLQFISNILPLRYGVNALTDIMIRGCGLTEILGDLAIVWAFIIVFILAASMGLRKKHAKA